MLPGDTSPLLSAPRDAVVAVMSREGAAAREADARALEVTLGRVLGARLTDESRKRLHDALDSGAKGGGDWWTASFLGGPSKGVVLTTPTRDKEALTRAVRTGADLLGRPGFKEPLAHLLGASEPTWRSVDVPGLGKGTVVTWSRGGGRAPAAQGGGEMAWVIGEQLDLALVGGGASGGAAASLGASPRLGDDPRIARPLGAAETSAVFAVVAQPLKLDPVRSGNESAPVVLAWGRRGAQGWARADVSGVLLRELLRVTGRP
jgi:hypothetical protein